MYSHVNYTGWTEGMVKRTFYFTTPYPTTKVRIDQLEGPEELAFRVEFLGLDQAKRNIIANPMEGGYVTSSKNIKICFKSLVIVFS